MAPYPSGKAKVCNTSITSSNLVGASKRTRKINIFRVLFLRVVKNKIDDKVDGVIRLQDHTSTGNVHSG